MGEKEWCPANVLDLFGDPIARALLVAASKEPVAVKDLAAEFDVSDPTIYRRIDPLVEANLLKEYRKLDENGNQHCEYETTLDRAVFEVSEDGYTVDIQVEQDLSEDFESMWSDLETGSRGTDGSRSTPSEGLGGDLS